jgi:signal transduction histidine kinase
LFAGQKLESIGTLAGGIAHDVNNLLGGVAAQADVALSELAAGENPEEELRTIRDVAIRGSEIVRELMIYGRKENSVLRLVDVSRIVIETVDLLKVSFVSKHAVLEADLTTGFQVLRANGAQIRRIVMNLVINASDAIGDRAGIIRIITRRVTLDGEGEYLSLEVSDTGPGMSPETQSKVFDPFFTTKSAGRGLGLAVVSGIVRGLGGTIRLTSKLGEGTTFQILLPFSEDTGLSDAATAGG